MFQKIFLSILSSALLLLLSPETSFAFSGSGSGAINDPYQIATCEQLQEMDDDLSAYYILSTDVDCSGTSSWNGGAGFIPVGDENNPFEGSLDGNGKTISGLFINKGEGEDYTGLFGYTDGASVTDLTLSNINFTGWGNIGGVVGYAGSSTVLENISVSGTINGRSSLGGVVGELRGGSSISDSDASVTISGTTYVGGLVGYTDVPITNSYATGNVSGNGDYSVGGLVGETYNDITDSYATGDVYAPNYGGGLAGYVNGDVTRSYATGDVEVDGQFAGGLVGQQEDGTLINSYARGSVQGDDTVGGLLGSANRLTVENSYSTGAVSGNDAVGGLIGTSRDSTVWRSFWDTQTSGQSSSDGGEGKTTVELKNLATYTSPGVTVTFDSYSYTTANDSPDVRDPISWTLFGSNNGSDWTEIDSRADQTITDERETETSVFSLSGDATYSYLKWEITKRKGTGDCCVQAADLNLYLNTNPVSWNGAVFVTNPNGEGPADEGPNNLTDGISSTKWLDNQFSEDEDQEGFTELIFNMNGRVWDIEASDNELNDGYPYLSWQVGGSSPVWYVSGSVEASNSSSEQPSGSGDLGSVPSCNDPEPSGVPDLFRIDSAGTYANLYFTGIDGSSGYSINYGLTPQADQYGDLFDYSNPDWIIGRTISGLSPNTTYYFRVQALKGCNGGVWSNIVQVRTKGLFSNITQWFASLVPVNPVPQQAAGSANVLGVSSISSNSCSYIVRQGDSLWKIASEQLGSGVKHTELAALNPGVGLLQIGQTIKLCK